MTADKWMARMLRRDLPEGTVTFLMTDVEGSTRKWAEHPERMRASLERHDRLAQRVIERHHGILVKQRGEGDSLFAVFRRCLDAARATVDLHHGLQEHDEGRMLRLSVRAAIHVGETLLRDEDYYGPVVNRCARLRSIAHAGQTLVSESVAQILHDELPSDLVLKDLGHHRLKDLLRPERVYEIQPKCHPHDFPPLRSLNHHTANLPVQLTTLVGREEEVAQVVRQVRMFRLVTLTGSGGCGKTRLALQVAAEMVEAMPDGVFFVDLADATPEDPIPRVIARTLHLTEEPGQDPLQVLQDRLADGRALILLDNCEHVVDAAADASEALLRACPGLHILATSRELLRVPGEAAFRAPSLSLPPAVRGLPAEDLLRYEAVALFAERAARRSTGFTLTDGNADAVAEICRLLDGIPLALEQAASNVGFLTPAQILEGLRQGFEGLRSGDRGVLPRHKTLEATNEWSYSTLTDEEKALFTRLSVFSGGWTLSAAQEVCAGEGLSPSAVPALLGALVSKSLANADDEPNGDKRYRYLQSVREFGLKKLSEAEETWRARHFEWCLSLARHAAPELQGKDQALWLERLDRDYSNLRQALDWGWRTHQNAFLDFVFQIRHFWLRRGDLREARSWVERALESSIDAPARLRAQGLNLLGAIKCQQGDERGAVGNLEVSLAIWRELNDPSEEAAVLNNLGLVSMESGDYPPARDAFAESLSTYTRLGLTAKQASAAFNLGLVEMLLENYDRALTLLEQTRELAREVGNLHLDASACMNMADAAMKQERHGESIARLGETVSSLRNVKSKSLTATTLTLVAFHAHHGALTVEGARLLGAANAIREAIGQAAVGHFWSLHAELSHACGAELGNQEWVKSFAAGRALTLEAALDESQNVLHVLTSAPQQAQDTDREPSRI